MNARIIIIITGSITTLIAIGDATVMYIGSAAIAIGMLAGLLRSKTDGLPRLTLTGPPPRNCAVEKGAAALPKRWAA